MLHSAGGKHLFGDCTGVTLDHTVMHSVEVELSSRCKGALRRMRVDPASLRNALDIKIESKRTADGHLVFISVFQD